MRHHACIVEDDVDAAVLLDCAVDGGLNLRRVGHVRDERGRLAACCARGAYFAYGYPAVVFRDLNHFIRERFGRYFRHGSQRRARPFRRGETLYAGLARYGFAPLAVRS